VASADRRHTGRGGRRRTDTVAPLDLRGATPVVLIVDDHHDSREMLAEYFAFHGFRVRVASTGQQALAAAAATKLDVVLLDLMLPDINGIEVVERLRALPGARSVPIVMHTAAVLGDVRQRVSAAGVTMFIPKPSPIEHVVLQVLSLVHRPSV
jgi:CheY-like chemotaxis protein